LTEDTEGERDENKHKYECLLPKKILKIQMNIIMPSIDYIHHNHSFVLL